MSKYRKYKNFIKNTSQSMRGYHKWSTLRPPEITAYDPSPFASKETYNSISLTKESTKISPKTNQIPWHSRLKLWWLDKQQMEYTWKQPRGLDVDDESVHSRQDIYKKTFQALWDHHHHYLTLRTNFNFRWINICSRNDRFPAMQKFHEIKKSSSVFNVPNLNTLMGDFSHVFLQVSKNVETKALIIPSHHHMKSSLVIFPKWQPSNGGCTNASTVRRRRRGIQ